MIVNTGTTPLARATATHGHAARAVTRPLAVATATENITPTNSNDAQFHGRTRPMISATIASWATAHRGDHDITLDTDAARARGHDGEHQQRNQGNDELPAERGGERHRYASSARRSDTTHLRLGTLSTAHSLRPAGLTFQPRT